MSSVSEETRPWALITGASEGLGLSFAFLLAQRGTHNLVLVARTEAKLVKAAAKIREGNKGIDVRVLSADLSQIGAAESIDIATKDLKVSILINNAGIATGGQFEDIPIQDVGMLISLNIVALTELFHKFLPRVKKLNVVLREQQKRTKYALSGIINVSSMSAFAPIPSMALYSASKSFVLFLSEAVQREQRNEGSDVRIVCTLPGVTSTEIWSKGGANSNTLRLPLGTPEWVCQISLGALDKPNKSLVVPGYLNSVLAFGQQRLTPRWLNLTLSRFFMGQDPALRDASEVKDTFAKLGRSVSTREYET